MKKIILYISLCWCFALNGQELSKDTLQKNLVGYWEGNKLTNNKEVLVISGDNTYQFFKNKVKVDYGSLEIEYQTMFRLKFDSWYGDSGLYEWSSTRNNYIWHLPTDKLQFGDSPVDGNDAFFDRMTPKEIDDFWGRKLISKAFKKKSEKLLLQYFAEWQLMESNSNRWNVSKFKEFSIYQKEAYAIFSDFYAERLKDVEEPKYTIVEISLHRTGHADFSLPTETQLDSFVNMVTGKIDYKAEINDPKKYKRIVMENFWVRYFEKKLESQKIAYDRLENFIPVFPENKFITYLPLRASRAKVMDYCMRKNDKKYRNWDFIKQYLCSGGGVQYDVTDTPTIKNIIFNTQLNLAIVEYVYPYSWVKDLYEKKDGKWQFHSTIEHIIE